MRTLLPKEVLRSIFLTLPADQRQQVEFVLKEVEDRRPARYLRRTHTDDDSDCFSSGVAERWEYEYPERGGECETDFEVLAKVLLNQLGHVVNTSAFSYLYEKDQGFFKVYYEPNRGGDRILLAAVVYEEEMIVVYHLCWHSIK